MISLGGLCDLLASGRFDLTDEKACQAEIAAHLAGAGVGFVREHRLSGRDIPDFMVEGGIALEVKMRGASRLPVLRQLVRYALHDGVTELVLATNRAMDLPVLVAGKPLAVVSLGSAWL